MPEPSGVCYIDTSAFMKFYVKEPGSKKLARWFGPRVTGFTPALPLYTSALGYPEAMSAIARKRNTGALAAGAVLGVWSRILGDFLASRPVYRIIPPSEGVVMRAALLVVRHGLRAYDAVHLASALTLRNELPPSETLTFVTCDIRLKQAALAEHLPVLDPTV
jgi:uncharacterized protein